ncbi:MAG: hypothetical protein AB7N76_24860 [Planctomycetota bacterium]
MPAASVLVLVLVIVIVIVDVRVDVVATASTTDHDYEGTRSGPPGSAVSELQRVRRRLDPSCVVLAGRA